MNTIDKTQALDKLIAFKGLLDRKNNGEKVHNEIVELYGEIEGIIMNIDPIPIVKVPIHRGQFLDCKTYVEAGYLSGRTIHTGQGYNQVVKVIGKLKSTTPPRKPPQIRSEVQSSTNSPPSTSTIVIHQSGGIVSFGDHAVNIQKQYLDASRVLHKLTSAVQNATLTSEQKQKAQAKIMTIEAQLSDPEPDKTIIQRAYEGMGFLATVGGCADLMVKLATLLSPLLIGT